MATNASVVAVRNDCSWCGSFAYWVILGEITRTRTRMATTGPIERQTPSRDRSMGSWVIAVAREPKGMLTNEYSVPSTM